MMRVAVMRSDAVGARGGGRAFWRSSSRRRIAFFLEATADDASARVGRTAAEQTLSFDRNRTVETSKRIRASAFG